MLNSASLTSPARDHILAALLGVCAFACGGSGGIDTTKMPEGGGSGGVPAGGSAAAGSSALSGAGTGGGSGGGSAGTAAGGTSTGGSAQGMAGGGPMGGAAAVVAAGVRWVGRVDISNPSEIKFAWSGSGFVGSFSGATVSAKLKTVGGGDIFFQPVIDGKPGARFSVGPAEKTVQLAQGLGAGEHRVELYRETEGKGFGYSVFTGFPAGTPATPPAASGRLIEVIGDSISAGYGNLGAETHPGYGPDPNGGCPFTTETESAYMTYGLIAARAVNADASVLAGSGWGIYSDNGGNTANVMPALYGHVLGEQGTPAWAFEAKPQAVVINLGTNDASAKNLTPDKFKPALSAFISTVRSNYPEATIWCAVGSLLSGAEHDNAKQYIAEIITDLGAKGDAKLKLLDLGTQDVLKGTGCDWHPNVAENERMAALLASELKSALGW